MTHQRLPLACVVLLTLLGLVALPASAQFQEDPVTWSVELSQDQARPGDQVIIAVVATVTDIPDEEGKHWHFYPRAEQHTGIEIATSITPDGTDLPMRVGAVQWPDPEMIINAMGEPQPAYQGVQRFYIPVVIDPDAEPGEQALPVAVHFQVCSSFCLAPKTINLTPTIEVVAADAAAPENRASTGAFAGFDASVWPDLAQGIGLAEAAEAGAGGAEDEGLVLDLYFFEIDLSSGGIVPLAVLFLAAIFGGLLLNFTPCVLPVIPIKIMSLSKSGGDRGKTMFLGVVMFAGVVSFWLAIGAAIAFVKNFNAVNQLFQQPLFTLGIGIIIAVMAVGMCGLFTVGLPQWVYRINPKHDSVHGSFGFGVMTAVLATPCTAPFMGAAVAASTKLDSSAITLAVFAAVGLGMGGPYLVLAAFPKLVDRVPKTGPGSELLKQVMGILMLGAAVFFIGNAVVGLTSDGTQAASRVYWWAVGACILAAGGWLIYKINTLGSSSTKRAVFSIVGVLAILLGGVTGYAMSRPDHTIHWVYYSPAALQAELDKGNVVVIDFTAEWCLNCKTLEKAVLNPEPVSTELARSGVTPIKVDITSSANVDGNALLQEMQRNTIPLLVVMAPNGEIVFKADTYTAEQVINAIREAEAVGGRSAER